MSCISRCLSEGEVDAVGDYSEGEMLLPESVWAGDGSVIASQSFLRRSVGRSHHPTAASMDSYAPSPSSRAGVSFSASMISLEPGELDVPSHIREGVHAYESGLDTTMESSAFESTMDTTFGSTFGSVSLGVFNPKQSSTISCTQARSGNLGRPNEEFSSDEDEEGELELSVEPGQLRSSRASPLAQSMSFDEGELRASLLAGPPSIYSSTYDQGDFSRDDDCSSDEV